MMRLRPFRAFCCVNERSLLLAFGRHLQREMNVDRAPLRFLDCLRLAFRALRFAARLLRFRFCFRFHFWFVGLNRDPFRRHRPITNRPRRFNRSKRHVFCASSCYGISCTTSSHPIARPRLYKNRARSRDLSGRTLGMSRFALLVNRRELLFDPRQIHVHRERIQTERHRAAVRTDNLLRVTVPELFGESVH